MIGVKAAADVDSNLHWRQLYVILCAMFPSFFAPRLSDSNKATMDKILYHIHKATLEIEKNADYINNPSFFQLPEEDDGKNGYDYP